MSNNERLTKDGILKLAIEGYSYELKALIDLFQSSTGATIAPLFSNYNNFINEKRASILGDNILKLLTSNNLIDATDPSPISSKLFACANLAASCEIFNGWSIPLSTVDINKSDEFLNMAISSAIKAQPNLGQNMAVRLNNADTIRVIQILKLLGLLTIEPEYFQLSTGSSIGIRDRVATHVTPHISINHTIKNSPVQLSTIQSQVNDIILIDNDIKMKTAYEQLNASQQNVHAINKDVYIGLEEVAESIANNMLEPRTLITAYRLEPRAYTDIPRYISSIGRVIDSQADFVTTIGSGDTDQEFMDRKRVIDDLYNDLINRGMKPLRVKMYHGETVQQQRSNPTFGLNQYASYEILYCKLLKDRFQ
ncbi:MAG: hypothetical protein KAS57_09105 [Gammaproteobacteria bacterium]|nr:hypothetical protein [Gammaproteobacteria bacterium]